MESDVGELLAAGAVNGIGKSRMLGIQFGAVGQDLIGEFIQIGDPSGEPRHRSRSINCNYIKWFQSIRILIQFNLISKI